MHSKYVAYDILVFIFVLQLFQNIFNQNDEKPGLLAGALSHDKSGRCRIYCDFHSCFSFSFRSHLSDLISLSSLISSSHFTVIASIVKTDCTLMK